jgi:23S rRNA (cytosine1962-C5)-methyltransferase
VNFAEETHLLLRAALLDPSETDAFRLINGASDGWPGWYVERLGDYLLSQSETSPSAAQLEELDRLQQRFSARAAYHRPLSRQIRRTVPIEASHRLLLGQAAPDRFTICENGLQFELSLTEGYSVGLFLDQRDNRRRLLTGHIAAAFELVVGRASRLSPGRLAPSSSETDRPPTEGAGGSSRQGADPPLAPRPSALEILNTFAYTCAFSVCAAKTGARTTSLDLSKKYLEWGKRNFTLNGLDPASHDFIYGDTFDWLRRLARKQRLFDVILLDPPTFSQSKETGVFRAEKDYGKLVAAALPLLKSGGILFASTNAAHWPPTDFVACVEQTVLASRRKILQRHYAPQPPDFPISRAEPAYLKTLWLRVD